jgi:hypothetical protein
MTATEMAITEQEKEMYRKLGIDIERLRRQQEWEALKPVRKALMIQEALKTETVIEVQGERLFPYCVKTACEHCSCNPKNGGSGMCNCTLACPKIT